jgi:hypothetical protein
MVSSSHLSGDTEKTKKHLRPDSWSPGEVRTEDLLNMSTSVERCNYSSLLGKNYHVTYQVFTAVTMNSAFWDVNAV